MKKFSDPGFRDEQDTIDKAWGAWTIVTGLWFAFLGCMVCMVPLGLVLGIIWVIIWVISGVL